MTRLVIKGGCVLSMDCRIGNQRDVDVLVVDGVVTEVAPNIRARGADEIDASDAVVMPGFVDAHRHAGESLARHATDETALADYSADMVYAATLIGLLSAAEAGTTAVVDWCAFDGDGHAAAALQAHADAGLRTVFVSATADSDGRQHPISALAPPSDLIRIAAGPPAPGWAAARTQGLRIHAHAVAGAATVPPPMLGSDVTLTHGAECGTDDFDAIAAAGAAVVLTPTSDMAEGTKPFPVQELIDRGIRPGLGTGALRMASGDMFAQMRTVISLQHAMYFERKLAGKAGLPRLLSTRDVIGYSTIAGAHATDLGDVAGSIAPGRPADIVVLRTDRPNIMPVNDPIGAVVWGMDTSNVDTVLVQGRPIVQDGRLTADVDRIRSLVTPATQPAGEAA